MGELSRRSFLRNLLAALAGLLAWPLARRGPEEARPPIAAPPLLEASRFVARPRQQPLYDTAALVLAAPPKLTFFTSTKEPLLHVPAAQVRGTWRRATRKLPVA